MQDIDSEDQVVSLKTVSMSNPLKYSNVNIIVERWYSVVIQKTMNTYTKKLVGNIKCYNDPFLCYLTDVLYFLLNNLVKISADFTVIF